MSTPINDFESRAYMMLLLRFVVEPNASELLRITVFVQSRAFVISPVSLYSHVLEVQMYRTYRLSAGFS